MKKVAIITGGTSGIGFATVKKFLSENYSVVIAGIDSQENVDKSLKELEGKGDFTFIKCDVSNNEDCDNVVKETMKKYGHIDVLANVAVIVKI